MTPPAATTTPPGTIAQILEAMVKSAHPRLDKPTIAANHHMSLVDLDAILNRYGYPDKEIMARRRAELLAGHDKAHEPPATDERTDQPAPDDLGDAHGRLVSVPVNRLITDPDNPRDHLTGIEELADTIQEVGLLQPIVARTFGPQLIVVAGHRRLAAVKYLRWTEVDVIVKPSMRPAQVIASMLIENGQRQDLDPIEEARGLRMLQARENLSEVEVARKVGRSLGYVNGRLLLLHLPIEEQEKVRAGALGVTAATHRARHDSGRTRPNAVGRPAAGHLTSTHALAMRASNRCQSQGHKHGKGTGVGGVACGVCWEAVIRADEREHLHGHSARTGTCGICGQAMPSTEPAVAP